jgi:hypothetical protein
MNSAAPITPRASDPPGKPAPAEAVATTLEHAGHLRTLVAGLELWLVATMVPWIEHRPSGLGGVALGLLPLVGLAVGEALRRRSPRLSTVLLLGAVPVSIAVAAALEPALAANDAWSGVLGPLVALSLLFYLAVVLHSFARPAPTRATGWQPVPEAAWSRPPSGQVVATGLVVALVAAALVAMVVIPFAVSRAALEVRFPGAADDARTLAVAVGGGIFAVALGAIVGPALRARRAHDQGRERIGWAVGLSLGLAVVAAVAYAWLIWS